MTHGADDELSSVGFTIACGGLTAGLKVCVFLTSASVDLVRKRAIDMTVVAPLSPLRDLGVHAVREGAGLRAAGPDRRRYHHRRERHA
jgi:predicted peroxiredoxin